MRQVRVLIVLYWLVIALGLAVEFLAPSHIPESIMSAYEALPGPDMTVPWVLAGLVSLGGQVVLVVACVGLYRGRAWSPRLALYSTATFPFVYLLFPVSVLGAADHMMSDMSFIIWGALLVSAYSPRYREDAANNALKSRTVLRASA